MSDVVEKWRAEKARVRSEYAEELIRAGDAVVGEVERLKAERVVAVEDWEPRKPEAAHSLIELREWAIRTLGVTRGLSQDQRSTADQMRDLESVALMLGMYDAQDVLKARRRGE